MSRPFEELDHQVTELGELVLRRRQSPSLGEVYEVTIDGEFLMSSAVHASETALARLGLAELPERPLRVLVGGLGLGCTAAAVLDDPRVQSLVVAELLRPVLDWHERGLVPIGARLLADPRCELRHADFFALVAAVDNSRYDAILLDIDHSPRELLHTRHGRFYEQNGLVQLGAHLEDDGVFALWSADPPDAALLDRVRASFAAVRVEAIRFYVPHIDQEDVNSLVVARVPAR